MFRFGALLQLFSLQVNPMGKGTIYSDIKRIKLTETITLTRNFKHDIMCAHSIGNEISGWR